MSAATMPSAEASRVQSTASALTPTASTSRLPKDNASTPEVDAALARISRAVQTALMRVESNKAEQDAPSL